MTVVHSDMNRHKQLVHVTASFGFVLLVLWLVLLCDCLCLFCFKCIFVTAGLVSWLSGRTRLRNDLLGCVSIGGFKFAYLPHKMIKYRSDICIRLGSAHRSKDWKERIEPQLFKRTRTLNDWITLHPSQPSSNVDQFDHKSTVTSD